MTMPTDTDDLAERLKTALARLDSSNTYVANLVTEFWREVQRLRAERDDAREQRRKWKDASAQDRAALSAEQSKLNEAWRRISGLLRYAIVADDEAVNGLEAALAIIESLGGRGEG